MNARVEPELLEGEPPLFAAVAPSLEEPVPPAAFVGGSVEVELVVVVDPPSVVDVVELVVVVDPETAVVVVVPGIVVVVVVVVVPGIVVVVVVGIVVVVVGIVVVVVVVDELPIVKGSENAKFCVKALL